MSTDEQEIRDLVKTWMAASKAGDVQTVLSLMTDDVVFLVPGRPPMRKPEFAAISAQQSAATAPEIDGQSEIQEVVVAGNWAFMWTKLKVTLTPKNEGSPIVRAGHTLTIFKKQDGRWLLARDANLLTSTNQPSPPP